MTQIVSHLISLEISQKKKHFGTSFIKIGTTVAELWFFEGTNSMPFLSVIIITRQMKIMIHESVPWSDEFPLFLLVPSIMSVQSVTSVNKYIMKFLQCC